MEDFTHVCHTQCTKHGRVFWPGNKIKLNPDEDSRYFDPLPGVNKPVEPAMPPEEPNDWPDLTIEEKLEAMTKDELEEYALREFQEDVDKRRSKDDIILQILEWEETRMQDARDPAD